MSKVHVGKSRIQGSGVFAQCNIKKGEIVFIAKGKFTGWHVKDEKTSSAGPNWIGIEHDLWLDPKPTNFLTFTNHSCDPNMGIKGRVSFVAIKNIKKGEEVNFDYSITEEDMMWHLPFRCRCGHTKCRGIIKSVQFLPKKVFSSYLPFIPRYFQKVYLDYNNPKQ